MAKVKFVWLTVGIVWRYRRELYKMYTTIFSPSDNLHVCKAFLIQNAKR